VGGYGAIGLEGMVMKITVENDPSTADLWLTGRTRGKVVLGAQVPHDRGSQLALFWRGYMPPRQMQHIIYEVENLFSKGTGQYVLGTLYAYGSSKRVVGPVTNGLHEYLSDKSPLGHCEAYRAEFVGNTGNLILWANVKEGADLQSLDDAGDNIGIATSLTLFDGIARPIIAETIEKTKEVKHETVLRWLRAFSLEIHQHKDKEAGTSA
jgi:hypothetical protein